MQQPDPPPPTPATDRWKRALGRMLDSRGFTVDEWRHANLAAHRPALIATVQHILERLRLEATQADLLERDTLAEDWDPWLTEQYGAENKRRTRQRSPMVFAGVRSCSTATWTSRSWRPARRNRSSSGAATSTDAAIPRRDGGAGLERWPEPARPSADAARPQGLQRLAGVRVGRLERL